jgi:CheY-like chemotaxis protein
MEMSGSPPARRTRGRCRAEPLAPPSGWRADGESDDEAASCEACDGHRVDEDAAAARKRILLVEDDPDIMYVFRETLLYGGFDVHTAADGAEAVRLGREVEPDLILMDINMPVMSGWDATAALKADSSTERVPIMGVSVNTTVDDHRRASRLGMQAYFDKPFSTTMVLAAVQRLLGLKEDS